MQPSNAPAHTAEEATNIRAFPAAENNHTARDMVFRAYPKA